MIGVDILFLHLYIFNISQDDSGGAMKRKKSLPDVQDLAVVTKQQSSKQMTREEISVLSTQRRETMRRQLDEIERYKSNPLLYIMNPRMKVGNHIEVFTYSL